VTKKCLLLSVLGYEARYQGSDQIHSLVDDKLSMMKIKLLELILEMGG
jgi:hypothetical protein